MSNQISNTTSLSFEYGPENSTHTITDTTATATMSNSVDVSVRTLEKNYYLNEYITYLVTVNSRNIKTKPLILKSNLGTYKKYINGKNINITPLDYSGTSYLYIDGVFKNQITPKVQSENIVFDLPAMNEKSNFLIVYKTKVNRFASIDLNSEIKTIVSLETSETENFSETFHTIKVAEKADLKISKNITPQTFSPGEALSYNISIYNYGNTEAENIKITDTFNPSPTLTNITINEKEISASDYSYVNGTFDLPRYGSDLSIIAPSAKFETDDCGALKIQPSTTNIVISGIL